MTSFSLGNHPLKIVAFLGRDTLCPEVEALVSHVCDEGHRITIFGEQMYPLIQDPSTEFPDVLSVTPLAYLQTKLKDADAIILLNAWRSQDDSGPPYMQYIAPLYSNKDRGYFSWTAFGLRCLLIGGTVHSRKVAMNLRHLLEDSDYPFVGRVLPHPCNLDSIYSVDPACETEQPCVL